MRIQHNIMAMNTHRQLGINNLNQAKSTEKLSSGYRINRAADDAAGLYISEKMRSQIRGLNQASANAQDGISLIQAAEGALQESHSILQRMRELAVKAANDTNETVDDRKIAIQSEMDALIKELDRIAYTTEFNKKTLLDGSLSEGPFARINTGQGIRSAVTTALTPVGTYLVESTSVALYQTTEVKIVATDFGLMLNSTGDFVSFALDDIGVASPVIVNANEVFGMTDGDASNYVASKIASVINAEQDSLYIATVSNDTITLKAKEAGVVAAQPEITGTVTSSVASVAVTDVETHSVVGDDATWAITATDPSGTAIPGTWTATYFASNKELIINDGSANVMTVNIEDWTKPVAQSVTVKNGAELTLQVGANSGSNQTIKIGVDNLNAVSLGVNNIDVSTHSSSQVAIDAIDKAIGDVSKNRSGLGALQNRLEHTIANLDTVAENLQSAEAAIRDVDMAKEMMAFTKNNILMQAATAMLAQANQAPQTVLQLLR